MIITAANRAASFITTIDSKESNVLKELRQKCSMMNRERESKNYLYRIIVRARLGKNNPFAKLYKKTTYIRHEHGTRFDVYLYKEYLHY